MSFVGEFGEVIIGKQIPQIQHLYKKTEGGWVKYHHTEVYWHDQDEKVEDEVHIIIL